MRSGAGDLVREALLTLLFAVIAVVSVVTLAKTLTKPFATGSLSLVQWALFVVTAVGATLGFVRSIRLYASLSLLRRLRRKRQETADDADAEPSEPRMHPVADHLSWGAITLAIALINVLTVWALVTTLTELFGDTDVATGWLLWQLAVLVAALTGLVGLSRSVIAELRDRARRRRRNAVHVIANKLIYWPSKPQRSPSAGRRAGRIGSVAAAVVLAGVSWASASSPLLEPGSERGAAASGARAEGAASQPGARPASARMGAASASAADAQSARARSAARSESEASRRTNDSSRAGGSNRSSNAGSGTSATPVAAPPPTTTTPPAVPAPPASTTPAASSPPAASAPTKSKRSGKGNRGRRRDERPTPTPMPTPTPAPTSTPTPTPPAATPSPTPAPPCGQPPCGQGAPPPG